MARALDDLSDFGLFREQSSQNGRFSALDACNDKVLKLFGRRVGLCVEWSDVNGVQVCCK